jgi:dihydroorotate dehydrogenase
MYRAFFRVVLARMDPERAHRLAYRVIQSMAAVGIGRFVHRLTRPDPALRMHALGLEFESPVGVAAGFDKEGHALAGLHQLGFGHIEVGTVTAVAQPGNPRPRLFRLIPDRAVINRMGFNNDGASATAAVLARARARRIRPIIGVNIGKSRTVELDDAIPDYLESTRVLAPHADYLAVNVSSPNTPGLRGLQDLDRLEPLLAAVKGAAVRHDATPVPVLVKIAPDLTNEQATRIAELAVHLGLDGIIATNTTLSREGLRTDAAIVAAAGAGGVSGPPVAARSLELLRLIRTVVPADFCVISVGGVETATDVAERLAAGATLVQGYTAFLYRGPFWARELNRSLASVRTMPGTGRA